MCGNFCTGFIDFILKGKNLPDYTNFTKTKHRKFKNPKLSYVFFKKEVFLLLTVSVVMNVKDI